MRTHPTNNDTRSHNGGWQASLRLRFTHHNQRTCLTDRMHRGPLTVQRPFYPEGETCHLYLLHPPGGVVGSDDLRIEAQVQPGASALVTTPSATKFYRCAGVPARFTQSLSLATNSQLEWLPQENIFFVGAEVNLLTDIRFTGRCRFIGWEINCLGRPANDEVFESGRIDNRLNLYRDEALFYCDRLRIDAERSVHGPARLRGNPVTATLLAAPVNKRMLTEVRESVANPSGCSWGATLLDDLLVVRCLGRSTEQARTLFQTIWHLLRMPVLDRSPCVPRIWLT